MSTIPADTIEAWGYVRKPDTEPPCIRIMESMVGDGSGWMHFRIEHAHNSNIEICRYSISNSHKAYFTTKVDMSQLSGGRMKYRAMVIDNCRSANVDLQQLNKIGLNLVTNDETIAAVEDAFEAKGVEYDGGDSSSQCTLVRSNTTGVVMAQVLDFSDHIRAGTAAVRQLMQNNPLLAGQKKMFHDYSYELGNARVDKVVAYTKKVPSLPYQRGLFIATSLKR